MPKYRFFPPGLSAWKSPAPSYVKVVLLDGPRSADPPRSQGMFCASTLSTLPAASRPAIPLGSAGKTGRLRSQSAGSSRRRGYHDALGLPRRRARCCAMRAWAGVMHLGVADGNQGPGRDVSEATPMWCRNSKEISYVQRLSLCPPRSSLSLAVSLSQRPR